MEAAEDDAIATESSNLLALEAEEVPSRQGEENPETLPDVLDLQLTEGSLQDEPEQRHSQGGVGPPPKMKSPNCSEVDLVLTENGSGGISAPVKETLHHTDEACETALTISQEDSEQTNSEENSLILDPNKETLNHHDEASETTLAIPQDDLTNSGTGGDHVSLGESLNCPKVVSKTVPTATECVEIQFRCKLCQFTGGDKDEIASHFLSEHIAVEVRTIETGEGGSEGGLVEIARIASPKRKKKRGHSQRNAGRKNGPTEQEEHEEDDANKVFVQNPDQVTTSRSGRRRKVPFKFSISADDDGSHPYCRRPQNKKVRERNYLKLLREDESFLKRNEIHVPIEKFEADLAKLVEDWERTWFLMKSNEDVRCTHQGCKCQLDTKDREIHMRCHRPFLDGFQCPECEFVCVHWRNMRHHYYKEHQEKGKRLSCNQLDCLAAFERFGELKRHVTSTHLKLKLLDQLNNTKKVDCGTADTSGATESEAAVDAEKREELVEDGQPDDLADPNETCGGTASKIVLEDQSEENTASPGDLATDEASSPKEPKSMDSSERECEVESTKKRITKRRKDDSGRFYRMRDVEVRKKRKYNRSHEFGGNAAERQRALVAFVCDICGAKYNVVEDLEKHRGSHVALEDEDATVIRCTECDSKFSSCEPLVAHVKEKHVRLLKLHRCHLCKFASDRRFDLKKHLLIHTGVKNHQCDQCGKCMSTAYNLKIHYYRVHAKDDEKGICCTMADCGFKCADNAVLKDHLRQRHNLFLDTKKSGQLERVKLFSCKHCSYIGKKQSSLRYHMRIHLEDRQHKCRLCPYASKTKNNLVLHMRTHAGMQPMKCPNCDFRGATNKIVSEHVLKKHIGIKPYRCVVCNWSSSYSGNMWKHVHDHRKVLGDDMPEEPVMIITSDKLPIPAPLTAPSGRKRTPRISPAPRISPEAAPQMIGGLEGLSQILQVNNDSSDGRVTIVEVPISQAEIIVEGDDSATASALNSLAVVVATAREVAMLTQQATAVVAGGETADASNPYPVTNLFQQIAGQASNSSLQTLAGTGTKRFLLAPGNNQSLQSSTAVTDTQSQPQAEKIQFTIQPDGTVMGQAPIDYIMIPPDHQTSEENEILVNIGEPDLELGGESSGSSLQLQGEVPQQEQTIANEVGLQEMVAMTKEGDLVMDMVHTTVAQNFDHQYLSQNFCYVQSDPDPGHLDSQGVQASQQKNDQIMYHDSTGQVFTSQSTEIMYQQQLDNRTSVEWISHALPGAIVGNDVSLPGGPAGLHGQVDPQDEGQSVAVSAGEAVQANDSSATNPSVVIDSAGVGEVHDLVPNQMIGHVTNQDGEEPQVTGDRSNDQSEEYQAQDPTSSEKDNLEEDGALQIAEEARDL